MLNCCSLDSTANSRSDCTILKNSNKNIDNNFPINENDNELKNNNEEIKGGSCRLPKVEKKEEKDLPVSGFKRTKTKHFK